MKTFQDILISKNYVAGEYKGSSPDKTSVYHKYTGTLLAEIAHANATEVEQAIISATKAFRTFSRASAGERHALLERVIEKLAARKEQFSQLIAAEAGKPLAYARAEVERSLSTLQFAAEESRRIGGEVVPMDFAAGTGKSAYTQRFPVGPVVCISPFNFPLNLALHKIAPALACGCTVVIKPSPLAPLSLLAFSKILELAGCPPGVVNILLCDNDDAERMVSDERFKLFSFTGSPHVGWMLRPKAGKKKVLLELGGNAAVIVDRSADLEKAATMISHGAFLYSGQICISTQRILIQEQVYGDFEKLLLEKVQELKIGDPFEEGISIGPVISREHIERVDEWVKEAIEAGATLLCGGKILDPEHNIYAPTLLSGVRRSMKVCSQEIFGPVAVLQSFKNFDEALEEVNDSNFGLQAGVFTDSVEHMKRAHRTLEVGGVMINNIPGFRVDNMPYGGIKDSGLGREGVRYSIEEMTEPRLLVF